MPSAPRAQPNAKQHQSTSQPLRCGVNADLHAHLVEQRACGVGGLVVEHLASNAPLPSWALLAGSTLLAGMRPRQDRCCFSSKGGSSLARNTCCGNNCKKQPLRRQPLLRKLPPRQLLLQQTDGDARLALVFA